jgi:hypothetical protein
MDESQPVDQQTAKLQKLGVVFSRRLLWELGLQQDMPDEEIQQVLHRILVEDGLQVVDEDAIRCLSALHDHIDYMDFNDGKERRKNALARRQMEQVAKNREDLFDVPF